MSVLVETTLGDINVDLDYKSYSIESYNFLKLCEINFYEYQCLYNLYKWDSIQFGDPLIGFKDRTELRTHNTSIKGLKFDNGYMKVEPELIKPTAANEKKTANVRKGQMGFLCTSEGSSPEALIGSQIALILGDRHEIPTDVVFFGKALEESLPTLDKINNCAVDNDLRPLTDIRIKKIHVIFDPYPSLNYVYSFNKSIPIQDIRLPQEWRTAHPQNDADENLVLEDIRRKELTLEIAGDRPVMGIKPADNVLFICKLNALTRAKDLALVFGRFGTVDSVEIVRNKQSGRSLGYGFIKFKDKTSCEEAYKSMDGVLIDDRKIHVDFSQSIRRIP